jgi:hypothetical protein
MIAHVFPQFLQKMAANAVKPTTDTYRVVLLTTYTFSNAHTTLADVLGAGTEVATGGGYVSGGYTGGLALTSAAASTTGYVFSITAANPSWLTSTISAAYAVWFDSQGAVSNATAYPLVLWDFQGTQSSSSGSYTLSINAAGLWTVTGS